jgi:hypothetical protein
MAGVRAGCSVAHRQTARQSGIFFDRSSRFGLPVGASCAPAWESASSRFQFSVANPD